MTNRDPYTDNTTPSQTVINQPPQSSSRDYENGYVDGRLREEEAETNAISTGLLWALLFFLLGGAGFLSYFFFFNPNRQSPAEQTSPAAAPVVIPQPQQTTIVQPTKETQIIERTIERNEPATPAVSAPPQINIQVPPAPTSPIDSSQQRLESSNSPPAGTSPETPPSSPSSIENP
jgi:hypothetical protein